MRLIVVEGTPEEIAAALPQLVGNGAVSPLSPRRQAPAVEAVVNVSPPQNEPGAPHRRRVRLYVSTEVARACLRRRQLSGKQRTMLRAIYEAHPEPILATELATRVGYSQSQF